MRIQSLQKRSTISTSVLALAVQTVLFAITVPLTHAQDIGGHIGFLLPLVTRAGGETTTLGDGLSIGLPFGVTVKSKGPMALDFEFVPMIQDSPRQISLTVHPGVLYGIRHDSLSGFELHLS